MTQKLKKSISLMLVIIMVFQLYPLEAFATSLSGAQSEIFDIITDKSEDTRVSQPQIAEPETIDVDIDEVLRGISEEDLEIKPEEFTGEDVVYEMESKREANAKHFRMSDGSNIAVSYQSDIHYEDEIGQYQEIDNRLTYRNNDGSRMKAEELKTITDVLKLEAKKTSKLEDNVKPEQPEDKKEAITSTDKADLTMLMER